MAKSRVHELAKELDPTGKKMGVLRRFRARVFLRAAGGPVARPVAGPWNDDSAAVRELRRRAGGHPVRSREIGRASCRERV